MCRYNSRQSLTAKHLMLHSRLCLLKKKKTSGDSKWNGCSSLLNFSRYFFFLSTRFAMLTACDYERDRTRERKSERAREFFQIKTPNARTTNKQILQSRMHNNMKWKSECVLFRGNNFAKFEQQSFRDRVTQAVYGV